MTYLHPYLLELVCSLQHSLEKKKKKSPIRPLIYQLSATSSKSLPAKHKVVINPEDSWQRYVVWIFKIADLHA